MGDGYGTVLLSSNIISYARISNKVIHRYGTLKRKDVVRNFRPANPKRSFFQRCCVFILYTVGAHTEIKSNHRYKFAKSIDRSIAHNFNFLFNSAKELQYGRQLWNPGRCPVVSSIVSFRCRAIEIVIALLMGGQSEGRRPTSSSTTQLRS